MKPDRGWLKRLHLLSGLILIEVLVSVLVITAGPSSGMQGSDNPHGDISSPILKGNDRLVILGTIAAVSQTTFGEAGGFSVDLMQLKVESVLGGKNPGHYVRADFNHHSSVKIDPEQARIKRELLVSFREGKTMKIHLRPPIEGAECRWTVPPPPKSGEEVGFLTPVMLPVGNAKGYPDINKLPCYAFELQDIEETKLPGKAK